MGRPLRRRAARRGPGLALLLLGAACMDPPARFTMVPPSTAETISLLGDTLWTVPLDPRSGPARVTKIVEARSEVARSPTSADAQIHLARSTAGMGRLREAVAILNKAAQVHFSDPRVFRYRGEFLLWLRELKLAVADLRRAQTLQAGQIPLPEVVEAPGAPIGLTSMPYQTALLLGVALYGKGEFGAARDALREATVRAQTVDERLRATLWLYFAVRRNGKASQASEVLGQVRNEWAASARYREVDLLLAFKGALPRDSLLARAERATGYERALYYFGLGYQYLMTPATRTDAVRLLEQARESRYWTALPYLAAEADLARMRSAEPGSDGGPRHEE